MYKFSATIFICFVVFTVSAFKGDKKNGVNWQSTDSVTTKWNDTKKPIIVDIYTDWCHYCKVMDNTTYSNDSVIAYINQHFYAAKVNAENKSAFNWMGKEFKYIPKYKVNELAINLTKGNMVYPSTVIILPNGDPQSIGGALSVRELEMLLKYFGGNNYGKIEWDQFVKSFKSTWGK